jgi:TonB family protein
MKGRLVVAGALTSMVAWSAIIAPPCGEDSGYSSVCAAFGQEPTINAEKPLNDPRELLAAAAPLYAFHDASLKPWHLKGLYQVYDENGNPGEQGIYEYWWIAPEVYRSTWRRPGGTRTEWHTKDGRTMYVASGARILALERELCSLLVSAIPDITKLSPGEADIKKDRLTVGKLNLSCADIEWRKQKDGRWPIVPDVRAGNYCFDVQGPFLRVQHISHEEYIVFDHLTKMQGRIIPELITRSYGGRDLFKFTLDDIKQIDKDDASLNPTNDAKVSATDSTQSSIAANGRLAKKAAPVYPDAAKSRRIRGSVLLDVLIGTDGKVGDMHVLESPSPLLTKAAKDAVAQWQYSPYLVDGAPQEVSTRITVIFEISD